MHFLSFSLWLHPDFSSACAASLCLLHWRLCRLLVSQFSCPRFVCSRISVGSSQTYIMARSNRRSVLRFTLSEAFESLWACYLQSYSPSPFLKYPFSQVVKVHDAKWLFTFAILFALEWLQNPFLTSLLIFLTKYCFLMQMTFFWCFGLPFSKVFRATQIFCSQTALVWKVL